MWRSSSRALPWARVASFWWLLLFGLIQVPLTAQSTNSGLGPSESKPSAELSLSSLSSLLVERLKLRVQQSDESLRSFKKVVEAMNDYEAKWKLSEASLAQLQTDHEATLKSRSDLIQRFDDYLRSSEERAGIDAEAIAQARRELDEARSLNVLSWIGGAIIGVLTALGLSAIL